MNNKINNAVERMAEKIHEQILPKCQETECLTKIDIQNIISKELTEIFSNNQILDEDIEIITNELRKSIQYPECYGDDYRNNRINTLSRAASTKTELIKLLKKWRQTADEAKDITFVPVARETDYLIGEINNERKSLH